MKIVSPIVTAVVLAQVALGASVPGEAAPEAELRAAVEAFGRAFREADVQTLGRLLSDNYVHVNGSSGDVLGRSDWLAWMEARRARIENGELSITEYRIEDLSVVIHGDTAIVVGTVISSRVTGGATSTNRVRFSNTWLYSNSTWRRVAFHDSPIA